MTTASTKTRGKVKRLVSVPRHNGVVAPLHDSPTDQVTVIFKALGEPTRLEIFRLILESGDIGCTYLEETLPITKSTISYHIKTLYQAGLIEIQRRGRFFQYYLRKDVADRYVPSLGRILSSEPER